jgi:hypothetical protein
MRQLDIRAAVIRVAILVALAAFAVSGCGDGGDRQAGASPGIYEGRPVAVLPPETAPPPPPSSVRSQEPIPSSTPTRETEAETQPPATTPRSTPHVTINEAPAQFPVAKPVPGKPGFVYSPFESNGTMIDVTGYTSGTKVKDPGTNKIFIVP